MTVSLGRRNQQPPDAFEGAQQRIALALGTRCELRSHEILDVAPEDAVDTDSGPMLRMWEGKGDKYRETPCRAISRRRF